ncbi:MAG: radical SAM protein [Blastocatellia bacterium]|nr:radical SAM protein [Blastocatellia bacterium]
MTETYPETPTQRALWIQQRRGPKNRLDPERPYAFLYEEEPGATGEPVPTATLFLTNRECPYRCLMCDLWQNTLDERVPRGAIAGQIRRALGQLPLTRQVKLYNAGSFFDPGAIPSEDYEEVAALLTAFEKVIVECHPALLTDITGSRCLRFRDLLPGKLEVAIGLETVHPLALDKLNKRMTVADFQRAADFLGRNEIDLRVFLLLRPPFLSEAEGLEWTRRSLVVATECGAVVCSIIPTRGGNGAMEALGPHYQPPRLVSLEAAIEFGLSLNRPRVFADLWDVEKFYTCACSERRAARLAEMNRTQRIPAPIRCERCLGEAGR